MLTQSGAPPLAAQNHLRPKPSLTTPTNRSLWLTSEPLSNFQSLRISDNFKQSPVGNIAATPRRYSPLSSEVDDLRVFFRQNDGPWYGVLVKPLNPDTSREDVKTVFVFSKGFEDSRLVKIEGPKGSPTKAEAFVRFSSPEDAEEAVNMLNGREFRNETLRIAVISRPSDLVDIAARMDALAQEVTATQAQSSSSSSDGLPTPSATVASQATEYTTARHLVSPTTAFPSLSYNTELFSPTSESSRRLNGSGPPESDVYSAYDRGNTTASTTNGLNGYEPAYLENSSLLASRTGFGLEDNERVGDAFNSASDLAYSSTLPRPRRQTTGNPAQPTPGRFVGLPPLSTGISNYAPTSLTSPATAPPGVAPSLTSPMAANNWVGSPVNQYSSYGFPVTSHPPANPADQNPPCNTLYVGNLPAQTSEDELKALFCRQRGYKRMCFRTKPQGPMCFVEFEDIGYATKALTELYGRALSNSTKGGVRLSFSKNPLGVRSQNNPANPANAANAAASGALPVSGGVPPPGFATAMHNPPGLTPPANRQLPPISPPVADTPTNPLAPPGLFSPSTQPAARDTSSVFSRPPGLGTQPGARLPPGIPTTNAPFYPGAIGTPPAR